MYYQETVQLKDGRSCLIRSAEPSDAAVLLKTFNQTHAETDFLASYPDECTLTVESERKILSGMDDRSCALLAFVDGIAVGSAGVNPVRLKEKTLHRAEFGVSVVKSFWGLGIGRALTTACVSCARQAGYLQLELQAVADNAHALALYRSVGFVEYGRNPMGFRSRLSGWQELVLMRLVL